MYRVLFQINDVFFTFYSSKNPEIMYHCFHKNILSSTTVLNNDSKKKNWLNSKAMISERSCDWKPDKWQLCHHRNKVHFKIYSKRKKYHCFYCIFDQINAFLGSIRDIFQNHWKMLWKLYCSLLVHVRYNIRIIFIWTNEWGITNNSCTLQLIQKWCMSHF